MKHLLLNHALVQVVITQSETQVKIKMTSGQWVECEPLPPSLEGQVMAVSLASEIMAGKFYLKGIAREVEKQGDLKQLLPDKPILLDTNTNSNNSVNGGVNGKKIK